MKKASLKNFAISGLGENWDEIHRKLQRQSDFDNADLWRVWFNSRFGVLVDGMSELISGKEACSMGSEKEKFLEYIRKEYPLTYGDLPNCVDVMHHFSREFKAWQAAKAEVVPDGFILIKDDAKTVVAIERMVEQQVESSGMDSRRLERLDGERIIQAMIESQEKENEN